MKRVKTSDATSKFVPTAERKYKLSVADSRKSTLWRPVEWSWSEIAGKLSEHARTTETVAEYHSADKGTQSEIKDCGGFVGGVVVGGRRIAGSVPFRSLLTLDLDSAPACAIPDELPRGIACVMYTTHSSTAKDPRIRLVFPLSRQVDRKEYQAVGRHLASLIGIDCVDPCSYEMERLMYYPTCSIDDVDARAEVRNGDPVNVDRILYDLYHDWSNPDEWPIGTTENDVSHVWHEMYEGNGKVADPTTKDGVVGAFCRIYSIAEAINLFLSDIYEQASVTRYTYLKGSAQGGLVVYGGGLWAYSHHGTDPVHGRLLNAFDLVRLHLYGHLDKDKRSDVKVTNLPSYEAMSKLALSKPEVRAEVAKATLKSLKIDALVADKEGKWDKWEANEGEAPEVARDRKDDPKEVDWTAKLQLTKNGSIRDSLTNVVTILKHDKRFFHNIRVDDFSRRIIVSEESLGWHRAEGSDEWSDYDQASLQECLDKFYGIQGKDKVQTAFLACLNDPQYHFHSVREYIESVGWDGFKRVDKLFVDYLGAPDTDYIHTVTRRTLVGAIKRIYEPGCKNDQMTVLIGPQGIGKSTLLKRLGGDWFNESVSLNEQGTRAMEQLDKSWVIEIPELEGFNRTEMSQIKGFLSRCEDRYRAAYGRFSTSRPRQCVFFATTNDAQFLKDDTGNRRFWVVPLGTAGGVKKVWTDFTPDEVLQVWAEAKVLYDQGEPNYLEPEWGEKLAQMQTQYMLEDPRQGEIEEYLEIAIPENWYDMEKDARRSYIRNVLCYGLNRSNPLFDPMVKYMKRPYVCAAEVMFEYFDEEPGSRRRTAARDINTLLRKVEGWTETRKRIAGYGLQRCFERNQEIGLFTHTGEDEGVDILD